MSHPRTLALFDFDKTLVSRDSFRLFGSLGAGGAIERSLLFTYAGLAKIGAISNARYKELVIARVWQRLDSSGRDALLDRVRNALAASLIDPAMTAMRGHLERGDPVAILTASPEFYLVRFLEEVSSDIALHGTLFEEVEGRVVVRNLYGERKAVLAVSLITEAAADAVHVYTDHHSDIALMKLADRVSLVDPKRPTIAAVQKAGIAYEVLAG